jgi:hypothetical protein
MTSVSVPKHDLGETAFDPSQYEYAAEDAQRQIATPWKEQIR